MEKIPEFKKVSPLEKSFTEDHVETYQDIVSAESRVYGGHVLNLNNTIIFF